jgi:hypothetical protein
MLLVNAVRRHAARLVDGERRECEQRHEGSAGE